MLETKFSFFIAKISSKVTSLLVMFVIGVSSLKTVMSVEGVTTSKVGWYK